TRSRLRDADDIAALKSEGDGLGLDRGGGDVFLFGEGPKDRLCEAEFVKRSQRVSFLYGEAAGHGCGRRNRGAFKTSRVARVVVRFEKTEEAGRNSFAEFYLQEFRARSPQTRIRVFHPRRSYDRY